MIVAATTNTNANNSDRQPPGRRRGRGIGGVGTAARLLVGLLLLGSVLQGELAGLCRRPAKDRNSVALGRRSRHTFGTHSVMPRPKGTRMRRPGFT